MVKYKQQIKEMLEAHEDEFKKFKLVHDKYMENPEEWQGKLNEEGETILPIIQHAESILCPKSESTGYGKFSNNLSQKFWAEIRTLFPKIDYVGME